MPDLSRFPVAHLLLLGCEVVASPPVGEGECLLLPCHQHPGAIPWPSLSIAFTCESRKGSRPITESHAIHFYPRCFGDLARGTGCAATDFCPQTSEFPHNAGCITQPGIVYTVINWGDSVYIVYPSLGWSCGTRDTNCVWQRWASRWAVNRGLVRLVVVCGASWRPWKHQHSSVTCIVHPSG